MSGWCLEGVLKVSGGCLEGVWMGSGWCLDGVWMVSGLCLDGVWKVSGPKIFWIKFILASKFLGRSHLLLGGCGAPSKTVFL